MLIVWTVPPSLCSRQVCKENDICPPSWVAGTAGIKARRWDTAGPIYGTAVFSLNIDHEEGMLRDKMRIRLQGLGVPS